MFVRALYFVVENVCAFLLRRRLRRRLRRHVQYPARLEEAPREDATRGSVITLSQRTEPRGVSWRT